ncbi:MAG TPA: FAD-binding protein [Papillibacter sp.]|nr:FAD-binding protein [Papillibacter sp.]
MTNAGNEMSRHPEYLNADSVAQKWSFEIPPEPIPEDKIAETVESDVVVLGEGMSGLCTALSCVEEGIATTIVTASSRPVGRGGSVFAVYSKVMERLGYPRFDPTDFFLEEFAACSFQVDQRKWYTFYNKSEESMNWLVDMLEADGVQVVLENGNDCDPHSPTTQPVGTHAFLDDKTTFAGAGINIALRTLEKNYLARGGKIAYRTRGRQLVKDPATGRICGVIAEDETGRFIKFIARKAVVLATGDFSANRDMMAKYCPAFAKHFDGGSGDYNVGFHEKGLFRGEGHLMALWAGAAWQKIFPNAPLIQGSRLGSNMPYGAHRGLRLNANGERFMNEDANAPYSVYAILNQPKSEAFAVWGKNYAYDIDWFSHGSTRGSAPTPPEKVIEKWEAEVEKGRLVKGETIEEVVEKLGLPLEKTLTEIERYNAMCRAGADTDFYKKPKYLQEIRQAPFYGGSLSERRFFSVLGGPRTNHLMQICDESDQPLGGLYAAGTLIGDMFANCYNFRIAGHNYGVCLTLGYVTGKYIAANE